MPWRALTSRSRRSRLGTEEDVHADIFIPQKYGVEQMVGDTIGPGGVFKGLRTAPVMVDIAQAVVDLAPDAWLLNYTNPMAICTWAVYRQRRA